MKKTHLVVLVAVLAAAGGGTSALAQTMTKALPPPVNVACPTYVLPASVPFQTDWAVESPQGWLDKATVQNGLIYCNYGIDRARPADRPAFQLRRSPPVNHPACVVDADGKSLTCSAVLPPVKLRSLP